MGARLLDHVAMGVRQIHLVTTVALLKRLAAAEVILKHPVIQVYPLIMDVIQGVV